MCRLFFYSKIIKIKILVDIIKQRVYIIDITKAMHRKGYDMQEINRTETAIMFENGNKAANMVRDNSFNQYFKVIVKDESGNINILATRCTYDKAYGMIRDFLG